MADYTIVHPAGPFSSTASAALTGGQLVEVTGDNTVGPAGAASLKVVGQACHDAATGAAVTVYFEGPIREAVAAGAVAAGDLLVAGAAGTVAAGTTANAVRGVALAAAADGATVRYMGR